MECWGWCNETKWMHQCRHFHWTLQEEKRLTLSCLMTLTSTDISDPKWTTNFHKLHFREGFFYKDQTNRNIEWGMYIKPFGFSIWISILVTSAVCIAMLAMTGIKEKQHYFNLEISWLIMLHGIFNQGAPTEPSKNSSRYHDHITIADSPNISIY